MTTSEFHFSPSLNHQYLMQQSTPAYTFNGETGPRWPNFQYWQKGLRSKLQDLVGEMPVERPDLNVRHLWQRQHPLGAIEKIVFTSEPYVDVPAYVCLPHQARQPLAFMICLQGHSTGMHLSIGVDQQDETTPVEVEGDRDFALGCMARGIAALAIEQRSFGERAEKHQQMVDQFNGCHDAAMHALMLGRTLLGERVYDVDRAIDYLLTRGDVNPGLIGVMGNSGGGTISLFSAALLPRISFAMPSCYFCTFRDSIMSIYHCGDNYIPGLLKYAEMADILGLFAPKPVVIVAGKGDFIFPIEATLQAFEDLKIIYTAADAADRCHLVVGHGGHRFYAQEAWPVMLAEIAKLSE
jgi:dienelactone hydrolase